MKILVSFYLFQVLECAIVIQNRLFTSEKGTNVDGNVKNTYQVIRIQYELCLLSLSKSIEINTDEKIF